jgi:uncharacterized membrane protein
MAPLIALITLFVLLTVAGHLQTPFAFGWWTSLRISLAGMFLLTASAHWGKRRPDLIRMVPPFFPRPDLLVTATGILEILGALGLMLPRFASYAALGLSVMLVSVFPANIHAARQHLSIAGSPVPRLLPRTLMQAQVHEF